MAAAEVIHDIFRKTARTLGMPDPYAEEKRRWQDEILGNEGWIRDKVERSPDPFLTALKLSSSRLARSTAVCPAAGSGRMRNKRADKSRVFMGGFKGMIRNEGSGCRAAGPVAWQARIAGLSRGSIVL